MDYKSSEWSHGNLHANLNELQFQKNIKHINHKYYCDKKLIEQTCQRKTTWGTTMKTVAGHNITACGGA